MSDRRCERAVRGLSVVVAASLALAEPRAAAGDGGAARSSTSSARSVDELTIAAGEERLDARLYRPAPATFPVVVLVAGSGAVALTAPLHASPPSSAAR